MLVFVEGEVMLKVDKVVLGVDWDWAQFEVEHFLEEEFDASTIMWKKNKNMADFETCLKFVKAMLKVFPSQKQKVHNYKIPNQYHMEALVLNKSQIHSFSRVLSVEIL